MATRKFTGLEEELHETAIRRTGLDDFGDRGYLQGLRVLLDACDADLQLTETGWQYFYETTFVGNLTARLYAQKGWADHPEVLAIPIQKPLVIIGLPRTGTTALHRLLSVDTQFQGLEYWLVRTPMIRPPRANWESHSAFRACVNNLEAMYAIMPELRKAHDTVASDIEECGTVLSQSFMFSGFFHLLPTYGCSFGAQSARESYRRYLNVLRLIGASETHKRWLLKEPEHMVAIETLIEAFPDARIVHTHRDPLKAIPSMCSLWHMAQRGSQGEAARADVLGPQECAYWRKALDRTQSARQNLPGQFFDVDHRRFLANPLGTVRSIYEYFGLALTSDAEQQMRAWVSASPTTRHGKHRYSIDSYGITEAQIRETFADYRAEHQFN